MAKAVEAIPEQEQSARRPCLCESYARVTERSALASLALDGALPVDLNQYYRVRTAGLRSPCFAPAARDRRRLAPFRGVARAMSHLLPHNRHRWNRQTFMGE